MTKAKETIATTLEQHWSAEYDVTKSQFQCKCGAPLNEDMPAIELRAHLVEQLLAAAASPQVTTPDELAALPDRTVVRGAAGTVANLVGGSAYFFGYEASVSRQLLDLPVTILQLGSEG